MPIHRAKKKVGSGILAPSSRLQRSPLLVSWEKIISEKISIYEETSVWASVGLNIQALFSCLSHESRNNTNAEGFDIFSTFVMDQEDFIGFQKNAANVHHCGFLSGSLLRCIQQRRWRGHSPFGLQHQGIGAPS